MKNLLNKYQVPVTGWDYWYLKDNYVWDYDEDIEEYILKGGTNSYMDGKIYELPIKEGLKYWKERRYYRNWDEHLRRAEAIVENSVGKDASTIFQKVKGALRYSRGNHKNVLTFIHDKLLTFEREPNGIVFKDYDGRYLGSRYRYRRRYSLYFNEDAILCFYENEPIEPKRRDWRAYYERVTWQKRSDREYRKDRLRFADFYLSLINKPDLFLYFKKIKDEYEYLNGIEKNGRRERPKIDEKSWQRNNKWHRSWEMCMWRKDKKAFTISKRRRRDKIRRDLDEMMRGDFSSYYNSREYLYSIYKECHHFAPL